MEEIAYNITCWCLFCVEPQHVFVFAENTTFCCNHFRKTHNQSLPLLLHLLKHKIDVILNSLILRSATYNQVCAHLNDELHYLKVHLTIIFFLSSSHNVSLKMYSKCITYMTSLYKSTLYMILL
jgi:hypothetical protein